MTDPVYKPTYDASHALLIGIDDYEYPEFAPLGSAERDTRELGTVLAASPYKFEVTRLLGKEATRFAIFDALHRLEDGTGADDRVLIYFAGHGYTLNDRFDREVGYLSAVDTVPDRHHTALKMADVMEVRRFAAAKHIAFIFDACFSGSALGLTRSLNQAAGRFLERTAFQVLSAGAADQPAADFRSMTRSLIHLLRDPGSDLITMNSLGVWLQEEVTSRSGGLQIPQFGHIAGSEGGNFVFYAPATAAPTDLLPERLREALTDDDARLRYFAIAEAETHISNQDYGPIVISVLESMALDDPDRDVRRRALKALRSPPLADDFVHHRTPTTGLEPVSMTDITRPVEKLDKPYLLWKIPGSKTQSAPLTGDSMTIGRDPTCDIVIRHPSVSRLHGLLAQGPTGFMITDKGSTNGTAVNGSLVSGWCELINQDKIQLGQVTVTYIEPDE